MQKNKPSKLALRRMSLGLEQKQIAALLGHKVVSNYGRIEAGLTKKLDLKDAFKLSFIFKLPVQTLFRDHYKNCRKELEECINSSASFQNIEVSESEHCAYLDLMSSHFISETDAEKIKHHIFVLMNERTKKILNH